MANSGVDHSPLPVVEKKSIEIPDIFISITRTDANVTETTRKLVELIVLSDTHNQHEQLEEQILKLTSSHKHSHPTPSSDSKDDVKPQDDDDGSGSLAISSRILVHCGDFSNKGSQQEVSKFNSWLGSEAINGVFNHKLLVSGNHDRGFHAKLALTTEDYKKELSNVVLLMDELVELEGIRFFGADYYGDPQYAKLETPCDILLTHIPPFKIQDKSRMNCYTGSEGLRTAVLEKIRPKLHLFGHIHEARGSVVDEDSGIVFANCANAGFLGKLTHPPVRVVVQVEQVPSSNSEK